MAVRAGAARCPSTRACPAQRPALAPSAPAASPAQRRRQPARRRGARPAQAEASSEGGAPDQLAGQVSQATISQMREKITAALDAERVDITDVYGDGRHVAISVVASSFEGKTPVKRQQAVYKAIWLELQETVHAVDAMTTKTPAEAGA